MAISYSSKLRSPRAIFSVVQDCVRLVQFSWWRDSSPHRGEERTRECGPTSALPQREPKSGRRRRRTSSSQYSGPRTGGNGKSGHQGQPATHFERGRRLDTRVSYTHEQNHHTLAFLLKQGADPTADLPDYYNPSISERAEIWSPNNVPILKEAIRSTFQQYSRETVVLCKTGIVLNILKIDAQGLRAERARGTE